MPTSKIARATALTSLAFALAVPTLAYAGQCKDPWVTQATTEVLHHPPSSASAPQCVIYNYHGGQWSSYAELKQYVENYFSVRGDPDPTGNVYTPITPKPTSAPNYTVRPAGSFLSMSQINSAPRQMWHGHWIYAINGQWIQLNGPAGTIASGGGNVISQGGGNVIATGGGNLIPQDGAGIVSHDSGTLISISPAH